MASSIKKVDLFGVHYAVVDYALATELIMAFATAKKSFGVSALAVHGLMEAYNDDSFKQLVNQIDSSSRWSACSLGYECLASNSIKRSSIRP